MLSHEEIFHNCNQHDSRFGAIGKSTDDTSLAELEAVSPSPDPDSAFPVAGTKITSLVDMSIL